VRYDAFFKSLGFKGLIFQKTKVSVCRCGDSCALMEHIVNKDMRFARLKCVVTCPDRLA